MRRARPAAWTLAGAAALGAALWTAPRWLVPRIAARERRCLYHAPCRERVVALTIDDGPDAERTPRILEVLRAHGARATFFLISGNVRGAEALVSRIVAEGHELGNHLTRDEPSARLAPASFDAAVREAGGVLGRFAPVRWLRPGSGWYTPAMLDVIERAGYRCALGSVYPYDARIPSVGFATAYTLANVRPGAVIVLHDRGARGRRTAETLRRVLPALRRRGYGVVSLSELVTANEEAQWNSSEARTSSSVGRRSRARPLGS
ncbi:MAG TPA: chitin deacetylase family protein [Gemmatimonadaceae bacterium]|nr:chitin deacetylase family protein [Gemmatimonadaceae bacterium]